MHFAFLRAVLSISVLFFTQPELSSLQFTTVYTLLKYYIALILAEFAVYSHENKRSTAVIDDRLLHLEKLHAQGGYGTPAQ